MAVTNYGDKYSFKANSDLSTKQFYAVKQISDTVVDIVTAVTDKVIGFLVNKARLGETAQVAKISPSASLKVKAGGNIAVGAPLTIAADGRVVTGTTTNIVGFALQSAVANDIFQMEGGRATS